MPYRRKILCLRKRRIYLLLFLEKNKRKASKTEGIYDKKWSKNTKVKILELLLRRERQYKNKGVFIIYKKSIGF